MADKEVQNSKKPPSKSVLVANKTSSVSEDTPKTVSNKGQCSTSTSSMSKEPELTREVLSILQELNENMKSQNVLRNLNLLNITMTIQRTSSMMTMDSLLMKLIKKV
ncbi:hypothetical protein DPMN_020497 [Dreissena polymorpha]|uniref:Uncharacterized protein n=1 Tax=Dreissena polymorpha TaxID=45954 RepID=A0A9D4NL87_DREPO|nr:hypothetical protein DPMN_020497 [Dreissena polymorpha]